MNDRDVMRGIDDYVNGTGTFEEIVPPDADASGRVKDLYEDIRWGAEHRRHMDDLFRRAHAGEDLIGEIRAGIQRMRDRIVIMQAEQDLREGKGGSA